MLFLHADCICSKLLAEQALARHDVKMTPWCCSVLCCLLPFHLQSHACLPDRPVNPSLCRVALLCSSPALFEKHLGSSGALIEQGSAGAAPSVEQTLPRSIDGVTQGPTTRRAFKCQSRLCLRCGGIAAGWEAKATRGPQSLTLRCSEMKHSGPAEDGLHMGQRLCQMWL